MKQQTSTKNTSAKITRRSSQEDARRGHEKRACNLCGSAFRTHSKFVRFCDGCKAQSQLYHFAEWFHGPVAA